MSPKDVAFRDSDCFLVGELHNHYEVWERILRGFHKRDEILTYISKGVSVLGLGLKLVFQNSLICSKYEDLISWLVSNSKRLYDGL